MKNNGIYNGEIWCYQVCTSKDIQETQVKNLNVTATG